MTPSRHPVLWYTPLLVLGACVVSFISALTPKTAAAQIPIRSQENVGVYISNPDEDYFTPCGIDGAGDSWHREKPEVLY